MTTNPILTPEQEILGRFYIWIRQRAAELRRENSSGDNRNDPQKGYELQLANPSIIACEGLQTTE